MSDGLILCLLSGGFDLGAPLGTSRRLGTAPRAALRSRVNIPFGSSLLPIEIDEGMNVWAPR